MTSIIYLCLIDEIPVYVGSSYTHRYESRKTEHVKNDDWLRNVSIDRIKFIEIDECNDEIRFEKEGLHYDQLLVEGFSLFNKRDPRKTYKPVTSEIAAIGIRTKRLKGNIGNAGKSVNGHKKRIETVRNNGVLKRVMSTINSPESHRKAVETMRKKGNIGNGGKVAGRLNGPENIKATKTVEAIANRELSKKRNGTAGNSGKSQKGKISLKHKLLNDERRTIMLEMNCSWKEACKIRKSRKH